MRVSMVVWPSSCSCTYCREAFMKTRSSHTTYMRYSVQYVNVGNVEGTGSYSRLPLFSGNVESPSPDF
jgi:hypothetical protein